MTKSGENLEQIKKPVDVINAQVENVTEQVCSKKVNTIPTSDKVVFDTKTILAFDINSPCK